LLMESCGHRDMLVEALKLLEETAEKGNILACFCIDMWVYISLRSRCRIMSFLLLML
jgi:hypothetical protein